MKHCIAGLNLGGAETLRDGAVPAPPRLESRRHHDIAGGALREIEMTVLDAEYGYRSAMTRQRSARVRRV
ncbi:hypothetical protein EEB13_31590, partial [Rhodococcus sp. WS3]|uniref:hypothetical protein n=1 Tax=Rhodococcus sp. WS3 TaxID=2486271 RepID=UPI00116B41D5